MLSNIDYLFGVRRMIRLLISVPSFLVCTLVPFSFLIPILSHRYDINWILGISLPGLLRFTRSSLTDYMKRNKKCQLYFVFISFSILNVSLYSCDASRVDVRTKEI